MAILNGVVFSYDVQTGDTLTHVAAGLVACINRTTASANCPGAPAGFTATVDSAKPFAFVVTTGRVPAFYAELKITPDTLGTADVSVADSRGPT